MKQAVLAADRHDVGRGGVAGGRSGAAGAARARRRCRSPSRRRRPRPAQRPAPAAPMQSAIGAANAEAQMAQVIASILRFTNSIQRQQQGQSSLYPLLAPRQDAGPAGGSQDAALFLRRAGRAQEPRGGVQDGHQRSQPRQRDRLRHRRARAGVGARFRRARATSCCRLRATARSRWPSAAPARSASTR